MDAPPEQWSFKNTWTKAPSHIPNDVSIDAPLMGNGDITMSVGSSGDGLRYYLSKNDFWRLRSQADNLSGPRLAGYLDIHIGNFKEADFSAEQIIRNGVTTCILEKCARIGGGEKYPHSRKQLKSGLSAEPLMAAPVKGNRKAAPVMDNRKVVMKSWVSATENLIFIECTALGKRAKIFVQLSAPDNNQAALKTGTTNGICWLTRAFTDSVDIPTEVALAMKTLHHPDNSHQQSDSLVLEPGKKVLIALAMESGFKKTDPLGFVSDRVKGINEKEVTRIRQQHDRWWEEFWGKSSVTLEDTVLMKAYYQGLYTMAACSRDPKFPPGLFGWTTTDTPGWNGDYHLNYNFQAPFYGLYAANHLEQGETQDAPLLDFMPRGTWYARHVTNTRGILYPVGIGPLGIEVTRNFRVGGYQKEGDIEEEGLFYGQRSNAVYGLVNMAQRWRCTYDTTYGKKIYPYALAIAGFWEDYLKLEKDRYVIYGDAIQEGSGKDKNPVLSLGLVRNAFGLIIDLSLTLKMDTDRQAKWKDILTRLSDFPVQLRKDRKVFRYTEEGVAWWDDNGLGIQHIYPSNAITLDSKDELLAIARNTITEMQRWQDMNTSNSFFAAAIRVGYDPSVIFRELHNYALHTYPNGFQLNNPHGIENSCTVVNALNELFCMSAGNTIRLFTCCPELSPAMSPATSPAINPAINPAIKNARFKNLRAWGAFIVSARLSDGIVSDVRIVSEKGKPCTLVNPWKDTKVLLIRNGKPSETLGGNRLSFETRSGEKIELKPNS